MFSRGYNNLSKTDNIAVTIKTCPYCNYCGGCDYIDIPYIKTLEIKKNSFSELLGLDPSNVNIVASPNPIHYRTRCQLQILNGNLGFFKRKSHDLVEVKECLMLDERINKKINTLKFPNDFKGKIELYIKDGVVCERIVEKKYDNQFSQVNDAVNKILISNTIALLDPKKDDSILELYCGDGNFSFAIMEHSPEVKLTGIDIKTKNSKNIKGLEFIEDDVEKGLKLLEEQKKLSHYNKLLMDPPRAGVKTSVLEKLTKLDFNRIVYVSCNPEALKKDAEILTKAGFELKSSSLFDMFPFSKYVESLNLFMRTFT